MHSDIDELRKVLERQDRFEPLNIQISLHATGIKDLLLAVEQLKTIHGLNRQGSASLQILDPTSQQGEDIMAASAIDGKVAYTYLLSDKLACNMNQCKQLHKHSDNHKPR